MSDAGEAALVARLRRGEAGAFDAMYAEHHARIYAFLLRLARRRDVADDLFQETWINAARAAARLQEGTRLKAWLYTIARNAWVSHRRWALLDVSRLVALGDEGRDADAAAAGPLPDAEVEGARAAARLEQAIRALPDALREALLLVAVEGFDPQEAAAMLGIRYDLLRQRVTRARAKLAEALSESEAGLE